jgi:rubrerythrin
MSEKLSLEEVWRLAIQSEQEAQQVYQEMAEMVEDSSLKNLFAFLVEQENKHQQLLEDEYDKYFTPDY